MATGVKRPTGLLGHPQRLAIIVEVARQGELSANGYWRLAGDGAPSLPALAYHFRALLRAGALEVSRRQPVRGATETFYRLPAGAAGEEVDAELTRLIDELRHARSLVRAAHSNTRRDGLMPAQATGTVADSENKSGAAGAPVTNRGGTP